MPKVNAFTADKKSYSLWCWDSCFIEERVGNMFLNIQLTFLLSGTENLKAKITYVYF